MKRKKHPILVDVNKKNIKCIKRTGNARESEVYPHFGEHNPIVI